MKVHDHVFAVGNNSVDYLHRYPLPKSTLIHHSASDSAHEACYYRGRRVSILSLCSIFFDSNCTALWIPVSAESKAIHFDTGKCTLWLLVELVSFIIIECGFVYWTTARHSIGVDHRSACLGVSSQ